MKLGYSEFSFGYAFTENLIRSSPAAPSGAPTFPNLVQEAQLGYDVRIDRPGFPLFFQFKLPELMTRNTANEIIKYKIAGLAAPFFRMPLMRRDLSKQHERLIELEKTFPNAVFYASPSLQDLDRFNIAYNNATVHERSAFFSPLEIGSLPDAKDHSVAYEDDATTAYFCSQPREIKAFNYHRVADSARTHFDVPRYRSLESSSQALRASIRSLLSARMRATEGELAQRVSARWSLRVDGAPLPQRTERVVENLLVAREMARIDLGVDMLIAQPRE